MKTLRHWAAFSCVSAAYLLMNSGESVTSQVKISRSTLLLNVVRCHHSILGYHTFRIFFVCYWVSLVLFAIELVIKTFGCVTARTASRAFSRSWVEKGPRLTPPDTGLRRSWRRGCLDNILAGAECFLSLASAEYLGEWIWRICLYK